MDDYRRSDLTGQTSPELLVAALAQFPEPVMLVRPSPQDGVTGTDARIIWANPAAACCFATTPSDLIDQLLSKLIPHFPQSQLPGLISTVVATGEAAVIEDFVPPTLPGGRHAEVFAVQALDVGAAVCLIWHCTTHDRLVASDQAEADSLYRLMAASSPEMVYRTDAQRVVTWASPNCAAVIGWDAQELHGKRMVDLIHPADKAAVGRDLNELYAGKQVTLGDHPVVLRMRTKERGYRWMAARSRSVVDRDGQPDGLIVGMLDVNDPIEARLAAQDARREADRALMSMDVAAIGMTITGLDGRFQFVNIALCRMLGYAREELQGRTFADITHPDDRAPGLAALADLVAGRSQQFSQRKRYMTKSGQEVWVDISIAVVRDPDGSPIHFVNQVRDVTPEVRNSQALKRSVAQFRMLAENASDIVYQTDTGGTIRWISPSVATVLGWDPGLLVGTLALSLVAPEDLPEAVAARERAYATGKPVRTVCRFRTTSGGYRDLAVTATPTSTDGGPATGAVVACRDITQERRALAELQASEEQFRIGMQYAPNGMAITDLDGLILHVNPALCRLLGRTEQALVGHRLADLLPADVSSELAGKTAGLTTGGAQGVREQHRILVGDNEIWVDHSISAMPGTQSRAPLFIHQLADRTADRLMQSELAFRANHDVLTGLFNRQNLMTRLTDRLAARTAPVGLLFCDVDALKPINDTYGHAAGDAAIVAVADRLTGSLRRQDLVARIGGDEFVAVIDHCDSPESLMATSDLVLAACSRPIRFGTTEIPLTVSLGAVLAHSGDDAEDLLARADRALYRAKGAGRNRALGEE